MLPKSTEEIVYGAVERGELEIDVEGRIWRVKNRTGTRWGAGVRATPCERKRAEHDMGAYLQVRVMVDWKRTYCMAHRLVWRHFNGPIPEDKTVNHKNGAKKDNRPGNLELATYKEQVHHARQILRRGRLDQNGEKNAHAKLTEEQVREILAQADEIVAEMKSRSSHRIRDLARKYGVTYEGIWEIIRRRNWDWIG